MPHATHLLPDPPQPCHLPMPLRKQRRHANASAMAATILHVRAGHDNNAYHRPYACKFCGIVCLTLMGVRLQDTVALLNKDLTVAQEKLLQAEHLSNQRLDELEAARSQLQVRVFPG